MAQSVYPVPAASAVGPANSDIASAVAVSTSVQSMVGTQVTNNAPSASAIATAVAGAVPTISAINTSVANNAPSPNAWTFITSNTALNSNTITFSGLSGYKAYKILAMQIAAPASGSGQLLVRINNDSNGAYSNGAVGFFASGTYTNGGSSNGSSYALQAGIASISSSQVFGAEINVFQANTSSAKLITSNFYGLCNGTNCYVFGSGSYVGGASVSTITVFNSNSGSFTSNNTGAGFYLFGAN
jgi:hypothetical protein